MGGDAKSIFFIKKKRFRNFVRSGGARGCPLGNPSGWVSVVFNITRRASPCRIRRIPFIIPPSGGGERGGDIMKVQP